MGTCQDAVERLKQRPKKKAQQKAYSGKKKAYNRKSVIFTYKNKLILFFTKQKSCRRYYKRLADKESIFDIIHKYISVVADISFIGEAKLHVNMYIHNEETNNRTLNDGEKEMNKFISLYMVIVKHAIGGIKPYRCMSEKLRNQKHFYR